MFSKVTVELEKEVSDHIERNSSYLDNLQFDGELDVNYDDDRQSYTVTGDWYQVEWAWNYIEKTLEMPNDSEQNDDHSLRDSRGNANNVYEGGPLNNAYHKQEAAHESNIKWNITAKDPAHGKFISRPAQSNISMPLVRHVIGGEDDSSEDETVKLQQTIKKTTPTMNNLDSSHTTDDAKMGQKSSPLFDVKETKTKGSDSQDYLLGNPLQGINLRDRLRDPYEYYSDDTDDELEAAGIGSRPRLQHMPLENPFSVDPFPRRRVPSPKGIELLHSDFGDVPLTYETVIRNIEVKLLMGDILKEKSDAIVNPANKDLSHTYGISHSIARMAGRSLQEECRNYVQRHGQLAMGDVMHTCAGGALDEHVGFVLHTVPPSWREDEDESTSHILTCTYLNCLQYANKQLWLRSLSVPLIGAGK